MIEGTFFILAVFAITASIFFGAGYLLGRCMECKEAYDYIEHVFEMEGREEPKSIDEIYKELNYDGPFPDRQ